MSVHINKRAECDLDEIWNYIAKDNVNVASKVVDDLYDAMRRLDQFPGIGHTRADVGRADLRFLRAHSYLVVYRTRGRKVTIIRVVHAARNLPRLFKR